MNALPQTVCAQLGPLDKDVLTYTRSDSNCVSSFLLKTVFQAWLLFRPLVVVRPISKIGHINLFFIPLSN